jgi:hypothetical protein
VGRNVGWKKNLGVQIVALALAGTSACGGSDNGSNNSDDQSDGGSDQQNNATGGDSDAGNSGSGGSNGGDNSGSTGQPNIDPNSDDDTDGVLAGVDNCPEVENADQLDLDGDGVGDACDDDDAVCADGEGSATLARGSLYFLLDWSGSMDNKDGGSTTRWQRLATALDSVSATTSSEFDVGVSLFPNPVPAKMAGASDANGRLCASPLEILALGTHDASAFTASYNAYSTPDVKTRTPTGNALNSLRTQLEATFKASPGSDAIVLLTDGDPNSKNAPTTCSTTGDKSGSESAAQALAAAGIKVYLVGMGNEVTGSHLQNMANKGTPGWKTGDANQDYFVATDPTDLAAAFTAIREDAIACKFALNDNGQGMADLTKIRVILDRDGMASTPENDSIIANTAYTVADMNITLSDTACTAYRDAVKASGTAAVRIVVPCALEGGGDGGTCTPKSEVCNGSDDDCDGEVDEGCDIIIL